MRIRPLTPADLDAAEGVRARAFAGLSGGGPLPDGSPAPSGPPGWWRQRSEHLMRTDPQGCVVAEDADGAVVGFATSLQREDLWCLATFAVEPDRHGSGVGAALLDAADPGGRAMLCSSDHLGALRTYHRRGFRLEPMLRMGGRLRRDRLGPAPRVRVDGEVDAVDLQLLDAVDAQVRGARRPPDLALMLAAGHRLHVIDDGPRRGYALVDGATLATLAATDEETAAELLTSVLGEGPDRPLVPHLAGSQTWALRLGLEVGLEPQVTGYLAVRGMRPPVPYVPHGSLL